MIGEYPGGRVTTDHPRSAHNCSEQRWTPLRPRLLYPISAPVETSKVRRSLLSERGILKNPRRYLDDKGKLYGLSDDGEDGGRFGTPGRPISHLHPLWPAAARALRWWLMPSQGREFPENHG